MEEDRKKISKQILVIRKDLKNSKGEKVRTGKLTTHCAHASVKAILDQFELAPNFKYITSKGNNGEVIISLHIQAGSALNDWLFGGMFTKITVSVNSEAELVEIYNKAKEKGLLCSLITDAGLTEFNGVPTKTAVAIGPAWSTDLDEITGHLPLL